MDPAHQPALGSVLRRYRLAAQLTQEELAERASVSIRTISDIERGLIHKSRRGTLAQLAEALALSAKERISLEAAARQQLVVAQPPPLDTSPMRRGIIPPLVGRAGELARLDRHLAGDGPVVLALAGEPGIGKTRLVREAAVRAREQGWSVLEGGCQRRSGQQPYTPLLGAFARALAVRSPPRRKLDLAGCAWLVRLLPELAQTAVVPATQWVLPPEQEQRLMFAAARRYLANIAGPAGTLLVLDDLQWAGQDALGLLSALLHAPDGPAAEEGHGEVRVVAAYRSTEVGTAEPLGILLADLAREGMAARIELGPLADEAAEELLTALLTDAPGDRDALRSQLAKRGGGVPFFLVSCALAMRATADGTEPGSDQLPWNVAESIRQRVAQVPEAARALLEVVAVSGREAAIPVLLGVATRMGLKRSRALVALEAACHAGLLVEARGEAYACAHDLIREVVLADLSAARGIVLHRWVGEAVEQLPASVRERRAAELAWHFRRGGDPARALPYFMGAGVQAAANYAHADAERHFRTAVELSRELGDQAHEAEALGHLAAELRVVMRFAEAHDVSERAIALYHALRDVEHEARGWWLMCWQRLSRGHVSGLEMHLDDLPDRLDARLEALRAGGLSGYGEMRLLTALALARLRKGQLSGKPGAAPTQWQYALAAAEQAIAMAQAAADDEALAQATFVHSLTLENLGKLKEGLHSLESMLAPAEAAGSLDLMIVALAHAQYNYQCQGEFDTSRRYIERAAALVGQTGNPRTVAYVAANQGELAYYIGNWDQARAGYEQAEAIASAVDTTMAFSLPKVGLGLLCLAQGQRETAATYLMEPLALAERVHDLQALGIGCGVLAECDLLEGHPKAARARLDPLLEYRWLAEYQQQYVLPQLAWAFCELGDLARAQAIVAESVARARADRHNLFLVDGLRVRAVVATRQGQWQEAQEAVEESICLCRAMPYPSAEAKALLMYGRLEAARGEPARARERYEAALTILNRLGERLYAGAAERALQALRET